MDRSPLRWSGTLLWLAALLAGCAGGGGGGGEDPAVREPLPTVVQDILPAGERLDLRDRQYFPGQAGDSWTYDVVRGSGTVPRGATLVITAASGNDAWLQETVLGESSTVHLQRSAEGLVSIATLDGTAPASVVALVGDLLEYPEPFYAVGAERRSIRQGSWGEDLDGDGRAESFRLEISQVLVGFETIALPRGSAEAAHFRATLRLSLVPSQADLAPVTLVSSEDTWWAPGIGRVRLDARATDGEGRIVMPETSLRIVEATVGGVLQFQAQPDGTVVKLALPHAGLAFDRGRGVYYASVPGAAASHGNSIATIDAASGQVSYSAPVGSNPAALAVSADGTALYVGLDGSGEVLRLALPALQELGRTRLPAPAFWGQLLAETLAVSPLDAGVVAVSMRRVGVSPRHGGVALIRNGALQPQMTQEHTGSNLIAFAADGQWLYGFNNETTEFGLRRIEVLVDGLAERLVVAASGNVGARALDVSALGPVLGDTQYRGSDLALLGRASAPGGGCRVPLAVQRLVCLQEPALGAAGAGHLVVVDGASYVTLAAPAYAPGNRPSANVEIVPGPAGQVALRIGPSFASEPAPEVWLFSSPMLP